MAEKQGLTFIKGKHIDEYLSDEEVVQAILKIMMQSKAWQQHMAQHEGAQLRILSTAGFHMQNEEKATSGMVASVQSVQPVHVPQAHEYHGYRGNAPVPAEQGNFAYSRSSAPVTSAQQVVAGCNCGLVLDISAKGVNMHESQAKAESKVMVSYSMMQNSYVNNGSAGYGTSTPENKFSY